MKLHFEADLAYQAAAIEAVADLFHGQEVCRTEFTVTVRADGVRALIAVRDHGVGVLPADRERIFHRHHRGDVEADPHRARAGLGLDIPRRIVTAHGGEVRVEAADDGPGSIFTVELPIAATSARVRRAPLG